MNTTGIAWTDRTWNPVTGCTKVSQGCKNCYAERIWPRLAVAEARREQPKGGDAIDTRSPKPGNAVTGGAHPSNAPDDMPPWPPQLSSPLDGREINAVRCSDYERLRDYAIRMRDKANAFRIMSIAHLKRAEAAEDLSRKRREALQYTSSAEERSLRDRAETLGAMVDKLAKESIYFRERAEAAENKLARLPADWARASGCGEESGAVAAVDKGEMMLTDEQIKQITNGALKRAHTFEEISWSSCFDWAIREALRLAEQNTVANPADSQSSRSTHGKSAQSNQGLPGTERAGDCSNERSERSWHPIGCAGRQTAGEQGTGSALGEHRSNRPANGSDGIDASNCTADVFLAEQNAAWQDIVSQKTTG